MRFLPSSIYGRASIGRQTGRGMKVADTNQTLASFFSLLFPPFLFSILYSQKLNDKERVLPRASLPQLWFNLWREGLIILGLLKIKIRVLSTRQSWLPGQIIILFNQAVLTTIMLCKARDDVAGLHQFFAGRIGIG